MSKRTKPTPIEELEEWARRMVDQTRSFDDIATLDAWLEFCSRNLGAPTHRAGEITRDNQLDALAGVYYAAVDYSNDIKDYGRNFIKSAADLNISNSAEWRTAVIAKLNEQKGPARTVTQRKARSKEIAALVKSYPAVQELIDASGMTYKTDRRGQTHIRDERGVFRSKDFLADRLAGTQEIMGLKEYNESREREIEKLINPPARKREET